MPQNNEPQGQQTSSPSRLRPALRRLSRYRRQVSAALAGTLASYGAAH
ncbi:hypothetical protein [Paracidovorax citrulli]